MFPTCHTIINLPSERSYRFCDHTKLVVCRFPYVGIRDGPHLSFSRGMARDEERFPDPTVLKPERHLDDDGNLLPDDTSGLYFGYGRRICPGRYLADASTWLAAANMLSMFSFRKAIGPAGYEIDIFPKFTGGVAL